MFWCSSFCEDKRESSRMFTVIMIVSGQEEFFFYVPKVVDEEAYCSIS